MLFANEKKNCERAEHKTPINKSSRTRFNSLYSDLVRKGIFNAYVNDYLDENRKSLNK